MKLNRKNKLLIVGFVITLYICYRFAVSSTITYYNQYTSQKELANSSFNDPDILDKLLKKERQLDEALSEYISVSGVSFQNELLAELTQLCKEQNLKIYNFNEPHIIVDNGLQISSYTFSLEGNFNSMLLVINSIENNPQMGFIKHLKFEKKRDYKLNSDYLISEIILQKHKTVK